MNIAHFPDDPPPRWHQPVLALGNFDGLHRGHMKIIDRVRRRAGERGGTPAAMTFDPHPPRVLRPDKAPQLLMTKDQKLEALSRSGMQGVAVVRFTLELSQWDPEMFVRTVLVEWLHVVEVWVGANFLFGHERAGTFNVLRSLGARYGFRAEKIDPVRYKDFVVSSTRVRRLVSEGRVDEAGALLGHHYFLDGTVRARRRPRPRTGVSDREPLHLQRAGASVRRVRDHGHDRRHRLAVDHEHRDAPDVRRVGRGDRRDARLRHGPGPVRHHPSPLVRAAAARRARISGRGRAARTDRGGLPQRAAAVRPHFAVESCICLRPARSCCGCPCPPRGRLRAIAADIARKVAESLGDKAVEAGSVGAAVEQVAARVAPDGSDAEITFEFRQIEGELLIEARCGSRSSEVRCSLPA